MGTVRLLCKKRLVSEVIVALLVAVSLASCGGKKVNYESFMEKPTAVRKDNVVEVALGYSANSALWVKAKVKIADDDIYISGRFTLREMPQSITIRLPDPKKAYRVYWIDENGKKTEIGVR
jgi:hypothetical protein